MLFKGVLAFDIPALTKSRFGKNQSYKVLTPDRGYVLGTQKNRLHKMVLLSTQKICLKLWVRKY